jgi:hypothetical protein
MERISVSLGPTSSADLSNNSLSGFFALSLGTGSTGEFSLVPIGWTAVTYSDFYTQITTPALVPGMWYEITDYRTVWDLPDFDSGGAPKSTISLQGSEESIWVFATGDNTISDFMLRPSYPRDEYKWDWTFDSTEQTGTPARGRITYCKDEYGNETDYDHREIQFIRYEDSVGSGIYTSYKDTGGATALFYTFQIDDESNNDGYVTSNNNHIGSYAINYPQGNEPFILSNNVFAKYSYNNYVGSYSVNNTFGGDASWGSTGECRNNTFGIATLKNLFGPVCAGNQIDNRCIDNQTGERFLYNDIGFDFESNIIGASCQYNVIGDGASGNDILQNMISNRIGDGFVGNAIFTSFKNNQIGDLFYLNGIDDEFEQNRIGVEFNNNIILQAFQNNLIGDYFEENSINENFIFNDIDGLFYLNDIGEGMEGNEIKNFFAGNTIDYNFAYNYISNNFIFNTLGPTGIHNVVTDDVDSCTMDGDFQRNEIETLLSTIDFTANPATHVYQTYNCQIFENAAGTKRLLYYDAFDAPTIVDPDV